MGVPIHDFKWCCFSREIEDEPNDKPYDFLDFFILLVANLELLGLLVGETSLARANEPL
jgi:hypothetical protein